MKHCILIEFTRDTISFLYNTENGEKRFTPYTEEQVIPLAVLCNDDELIVGDYAYNEARRGNPNAYKNLFDAIPQRRNIVYRGETHDIGKLPFFIVEKYLNDYFERVLIRQEGSLDDNRGDLPLLLWFGNDLMSYERSLIANKLRDGGYGHVEVVDGNSILLKVLSDTLPRVRAHLFVGRSEDNLFCRLHIGDKYVREFRIENVANDPRIAKAEAVIWRGIQQRGYYPSTEEQKSDTQIVHDIAKLFVQSGKSEVEDSVVLSFGEYDYLISARELSGGGQQTIPDEWVRGELTIAEVLESNRLEARDCLVMLADKDAATNYIKSLFDHKFPTTLKPDDQNREQARDLLLSDIKTRKYQIGIPMPLTSTSGDGEKGDTRSTDYAEGGSQGSSSESLFVNQIPDSEDYVAKHLFIDGKFKEARDAYRSLNATKFANEIKLCNKCAMQERELPHTNEAEKRKILDQWKQLGVKREVIAKRIETIKPAPSSPKMSVPTPAKTSSKVTTKPVTKASPKTMPKPTATSNPKLADNPKPTTPAPAKPAPVPTISTREFRVKFAEYKAMVRTKSNETKGREGLFRLRDELHRAGIHDFDDKFKETFNELHIKS